MKKDAILKVLPWLERVDEAPFSLSLSVILLISSELVLMAIVVEQTKFEILETGFWVLRVRSELL